MILNKCTDKIKINLNGIETDARITVDKYTVVLEFETLENANNVIVMNRESITEAK